MKMAKNFQTDNAKHTKDRINTRNPAFNNPIKAIGDFELDNFTKNLDKYVDFVSWARFNPDLWFDLITPPTGGIRLDLDQRVFLRSLARFVSTYGVFPRG
jgi:ribonucleoside-diphosphate reductase alpha chain